MERVNISYDDIANRNGSETLFLWYNGKGVHQWHEEEGILLSWSIASVYDDEQRHMIIPVGVVQKNESNNIVVVPTNRICIKYKQS